MSEDKGNDSDGLPAKPHPDLVVNTESELLSRVIFYASRGLSKGQIAQALDMSRSTLWEKMRKDERLKLAYETGKARAIALIANEAFENAKKGSQRAIEFWLCSRDPENWKKSQHHSLSGPKGEPLGKSGFDAETYAVAEKEINERFS